MQIIFIIHIILFNCFVSRDYRHWRFYSLHIKIYNVYLLLFYIMVYVVSVFPLVVLFIYFIFYTNTAKFEFGLYFIILRNKSNAADVGIYYINKDHPYIYLFRIMSGYRTAVVYVIWIYSYIAFGENVFPPCSALYDLAYDFKNIPNRIDRRYWRPFKWVDAGLYYIIHLSGVIKTRRLKHITIE